MLSSDRTVCCADAHLAEGYIHIAFHCNILCRLDGHTTQLCSQITRDLECTVCIDSYNTVLSRHGTIHGDVAGFDVNCVPDTLRGTDLQIVCREFALGCKDGQVAQNGHSLCGDIAGLCSQRSTALTGAIVTDGQLFQGNGFACGDLKFTLFANINCVVSIHSFADFQFHSAIYSDSSLDLCLAVCCVCIQKGTFVYCNIGNNEIAVENIQDHLGACTTDDRIMDINVEAQAFLGCDVSIAAERTGTAGAQELNSQRFCGFIQGLDRQRILRREEFHIIRFHDNVVGCHICATLVFLANNRNMASGDVDDDVFTNQRIQLGNRIVLIIFGFTGHAAGEFAHFAIVIIPVTGLCLDHDDAVADFQEVEHGCIAIIIGNAYSTFREGGACVKAQSFVIGIREELAALEHHQCLIVLVEVIRIEVEAVGCQLLCGFCQSGSEAVGLYGSRAFLCGYWCHVNTVHNLVGMDLRTRRCNNGILTVFHIDGILAAQVSTLLVLAEYGMACFVHIVNAGCLVMLADLFHVQDRTVRHITVLFGIDTDGFADDGISVLVHRCCHMISILIRNIVAVACLLNDYGTGQILIHGNQIVCLHPVSQRLSISFVCDSPGDLRSHLCTVGLCVVVQSLSCHYSAFLHVGSINGKTILVTQQFHTLCIHQSCIRNVGALTILNGQDHRSTALRHSHRLGHIQDPAFGIGIHIPAAICLLINEDDMVAGIQITAIEAVFSCSTATLLHHFNNVQMFCSCVIVQQVILDKLVQWRH